MDGAIFSGIKSYLIEKSDANKAKEELFLNK